MKKFIVLTAVLAIASASLATISWTIEQVGSDVVVSTEGGSLNLSGAQFYYTAPAGTGVTNFKGSWARINTDLTGTTNLAWYGLSCDNKLSSTAELFATSATGATIFFQDNCVALDTSYVSGELLEATTLTFANTTLADMGLEEGDYATYNLTNDSMSLTVAPEPCTMALLGLGGLVLRRRKS